MPPMPKLPDDLLDQVRNALIEDIGQGDVTAALIPRGKQSVAAVVARESAVICGRPWFDAVFDQLDPSVKTQWLVEDGETVGTDQIVCRVRGPSRSLLTGERSALNFLQTLSGTATRAKKYAQAVEGTNCIVLDTRKTIPGLRNAQKYASRIGGCCNHRMGLYDAILIKENHIMAAGSIAAAVEKAQELNTGLTIEVEVENLDEFRQALDADADIIMLDELSLQDMRAAVSINDGKAKLEASGNVDLTTIRAIAETGVDYISTGSITKHVTAVDLSMRFEDS
ncbi:MAG: carboxylating nicotinate-nucleotide diphosphorylase [Pseudomonadota bacterium]